MREEQRARGEKRATTTLASRTGKVLPAPPEDVAPVVRFRNPADGVVAWDDLVKGRIEIANTELDDLVIARADGTPTYHFCVVVDDRDMGITHVIRGDDHVNNTRARSTSESARRGSATLCAPVVILGDDGTKLSSATARSA